MIPKSKNIAPRSCEWSPKGVFRPRRAPRSCARSARASAKPREGQTKLCIVILPEPRTKNREPLFGGRWKGLGEGHPTHTLWLHSNDLRLLYIFACFRVASRIVRKTLIEYQGKQRCGCDSAG